MMSGLNRENRDGVCRKGIGHGLADGKLVGPDVVECPGFPERPGRDGSFRLRRACSRSEAQGENS